MRASALRAGWDRMPEGGGLIVTCTTAARKS